MLPESRLQADNTVQYVKRHCMLWNYPTLGSENLPKADFPLLANLNVQLLGQGDWDNADLSVILVNLVEAWDKRDFYPAVEAVL